MCDPTALKYWVYACLAAAFVSVAIIVGAAIANGSLIGTGTAPVIMLSAAVISAAATGLCGSALSALNTLCTCTGLRCASQCSNMRKILLAAASSLSIQAAACLTVAAYAWIPFAALPAQWAIFAALLAVALSLLGALALLNSLAACASAPTAPPGGPPSPPKV
jgi:hypothetical protein